MQYVRKDKKKLHNALKENSKIVKTIIQSFQISLQITYDSNSCGIFLNPLKEVWSSTS